MKTFLENLMAITVFALAVGSVGRAQAQTPAPTPSPESHSHDEEVGQEQMVAVERAMRGAALAQEAAIRATESVKFRTEHFFGHNPNHELDAKIREAAAQVRDANDDSTRAAATADLTKLMDQYFEADIRVREQELADIESRLEKLRAQLDRRREKKQEIVDLQMKVALNEAEGLGFYSQPKETGFFNLSVPARVRVPVESGAILFQPPPPPPRENLSIGAEGDDVRHLQQALNERMEPSPNIAVDGDFGPETETAVKTFQAQHGMKETGVADAATRKMLDMEPTRRQPTSK